MKKSEKRMVLILVVIAIIVVAVLIKVRTKKEDGGSGGAGGQGKANNEEFVEVLEDGTKMNVSNKLAETKTFENYEISNIQLTEQDGQSLILADVKNIGETKAEVALIDITILDKDGNEIVTIGGIIGDVEPGQTVQLNASATTDFANAYDFSIKVSEQQPEQPAE